jgi:hypothetical protein
LEKKVMKNRQLKGGFIRVFANRHEIHNSKKNKDEPT